MLYKLPVDIQEIIFDYSDYKNRIKTYFKEHIASNIDKTIIKINYDCELCYIHKLTTKNHSQICLLHNLGINNRKKDKYYSLHYLPNSGFKHSYGRLFLAIDDIERFQMIIADTGFYKDHHLSDINIEIRNLNIQ